MKSNNECNVDDGEAEDGDDAGQRHEVECVIDHAVPVRFATVREIERTNTTEILDFTVYEV